MKLIAAASGMLLMLLIASQFLPLRQSSAPAAPEPSLQAAVEDLPTESTSPEPDAAENLLEGETFSGSATGRTSAPEPRSPERSSNRARDTIEVRVADAEEFDPPIRSHRPQAETFDRAELERLQQRLTELEQQAAAWEQQLGEKTSQRHDRDLELLEQLRDQRTELKTVANRLASAEERLVAVQGSLNQVSTHSRPVAEDRASSSRLSIRSTTDRGEPRLILEACDASLPELFARLGEASGVNLLVSPEITGTASLYLCLPDSEAALETVCRIHRCRQERTGNIVVVTKQSAAEQVTAAKPGLPETITKLYRLQHLSGAEIRPYVASLLTPGVGTVSFASIRERVARTEYRDPPRAILVKDTAQVLSEVDRLILELDRPPAKGKALRPISQTRAVAPVTPVSQTPVSPTHPLAPVMTELVPPPPAPVLLPPATPETAAPALLPTGAELPGPCLDCEVFEPPVLPSPRSP